MTDLPVDIEYALSERHSLALRRDEIGYLQHDLQGLQRLALSLSRQIGDAQYRAFGIGLSLGAAHADTAGV